MPKVTVEYLNLGQARATLGQAAARMAASHHQAGRRVMILAQDQGQAAELDRALWTYEQNSFLPHALAGAPDQADEPIIISTDLANPNQATVLIAARAMDQMPLDGFQYLVQLLPASEGPELNACRACYKALKDDGEVDLVYSTNLT